MLYPDFNKINSFLVATMDLERKHIDKLHKAVVALRKILERYHGNITLKDTVELISGKQIPYPAHIDQNQVLRYETSPKVEGNSYPKRQVNFGQLFRAAVFLQAEYPNKTRDLDDLEYHLGVLKTRPFMRGQTRPWSCDACFPYNFRCLIPAISVCAGTSEISLLILITTAPGETDARHAIRRTWASLSKRNTGRVRYVFLVGIASLPHETRMIYSESRKHNDIMQSAFKDVYYNLTYKVHGGFQWAARNCPRAKYVIKTISDVHLNIPKILDFINSNASRLENKQFGLKLSYEKFKNIRRINKFYSTPEEVATLSNVSFATGYAYLMSMAVVRKICKNGPNVPFFHLEDHWVGFNLKQVNISVVDVPNWVVNYYPSKNVRRFYAWRRAVGICNFPKEAYALHLVTPSDMMELWSTCGFPGRDMILEELS